MTRETSGSRQSGLDTGKAPTSKDNGTKYHSPNQVTNGQGSKHHPYGDAQLAGVSTSVSGYNGHKPDNESLPPKQPDNGSPAQKEGGGDETSKESYETLCESLEKQHVHKVYHQMAHHFKDVRFKAWPKVKQFILDLEPGSLVADVGCGNGKYLHINKRVLKFGSDQCSRLVDIAGQNSHEVMVADNLCLPYRDSCFDAVISIAVIHHFTTASRRCQAIQEIARILRPGGKIMICVWAMEQKHRKFKSQDVLVPWHFKAKTPNRDKTNGAYDHGKHNISGKESSTPSPDEPQITNFQRKKKGASTETNDIHAKPSIYAEEPALDKKEEQTFSNAIRSKLRKLIGSKSVDEERHESVKPSLSKKNSYRELMEAMMNEQDDVYKIPRPLLEHSHSVSEVDGFAIREFPMSSRPNILHRQTSLDVHSENGGFSGLSLKPKKRCPSEGNNDDDLNDLANHSNDTNANGNSCSVDVEPREVFSENQDECRCHSKRLNDNYVPTKVSSILAHNKQTDTVGPSPILNTSSRPSDCSKNKGSTNGLDTLRRRECFINPKSHSVPESENEDEWMKNTKQAIRSIQSQVDNMGSFSANGASTANSSLHKKHGGTSGKVTPTVSRSSLRRRPRLLSDTSSISSLSSDTDTSDIEDFGNVCNFCGKPPTMSGSSSGEQEVLDKGSDVKNFSKTCQVSDTKETSPDELNKESSVGEAKTDEEEPSEASKDSSKRFYHVFREEELVDIIKKNVECLHIIDSYYDHANWCVIAEKVNVWTV